MPSSPVIRLPDSPALVVGVARAVWLTPDGEVDVLDLSDAARRLAVGDVIPIVCHAPDVARRLTMAPFPALDILQLFAFVKPAQFALPTPLGMAEALDLPLPTTPEQAAATLFAAARALLADMAAAAATSAAEDLDLAVTMTAKDWPWGPAVLSACGVTEAGSAARRGDGLRVWNRLSEWSDVPPESPSGNRPVAAADALARLSELLGGGGEKRPGQRDYTVATLPAFGPRNRRHEPNLVLAEAGTGIGKTLGYIAAASLWAEDNDGTVWISTYTRNLQRQLDSELDRLFPVPAEKADRVVIRKGRENYLCLLNLAEAVDRLQLAAPGDTVALGLIARWASATRDGDMVGGDFPAWLVSLLGFRQTLGLTDTLGECIYSACTHYQKCFIERTVRHARKADLVIANHALVMVQAALGDNAEKMAPLRYVFDEGHQLFQAADSAFAAHLSGRESADLRRWLRGAADARARARTRSRVRGLRDRVGELSTGDAAAEAALGAILSAANALPGPGWQQRLGDGDAAAGLTETFLALVRQQVYARNRDSDRAYNLETTPHPLVDDLLAVATRLEGALEKIQTPLARLGKILGDRLVTEADDMDTSTRLRIEGLVRSITRRGLNTLSAWRAMLDALHTETPAEFIDRFAVSRQAGRDSDVGYHRHWLDPTQPLAEAVYAPAHGVLITSASLRDRDGDWGAADGRVGVGHVAAQTTRSSHPSPFDYGTRTRVLVVGDVQRNNAAAVAAAYGELFIAAGGGGLGLFTAISRLVAVHERIAADLEAAGLSLRAQHVDSLDTGTLIDIFRAEENTCLLGTDAVRDGVDVPGNALRLIVFDRVPWPRPTILHKARRAVNGGPAYDEMLTRLKLKQAYGRLLRRKEDRGIFVILDRRLPSRLLDAFPDGVEAQRIGLADAIKQVRGFFADS